MIANKTKSGSLIKITLSNLGDATKMNMRIIGENGEDLLFKEEIELVSDKENALSVTAIEWLNAYSKTIPYDGRVTGIGTDQITINVGERYGMVTGQYLKIYRPIGKKRHPLLEEIVNWEKRELGRAEVIEVLPEKSIAEMREYLIKEKPAIDDWALREGKAKVRTEVTHAKKEKRPKYGFVSLALDFGFGSQTTDIFDSFQNSFRGGMFGARLKGEAWFTENWWLGLDLSGRFGSLQAENLNTADSNETRAIYKIKGGYRFLPTGFFSGPQVDLFIGWGGYSYVPDFSIIYGPIDAHFYGVLLGIKGAIPIGHYFRTSLYVDFLISTAKDQKGGPGYFVELAINYLFKTNLTFDASFAGYGNKWTDIAPDIDIRYKDFSFMLGATFYF